MPENSLTSLAAPRKHSEAAKERGLEKASKIEELDIAKLERGLDGLQFGNRSCRRRTRNHLQAVAE